MLGSSVRKLQGMYLKNKFSLYKPNKTTKQFCSINKLYTYDDIYNHKFKFIDNKPNLVKYLRNVYCSGYKIIYENKQFIIKINYEFLNNEY